MPASWTAIVSLAAVACFVASAMVEAPGLATGLVAAGVLLAAVAVLTPLLVEWRARRPAPAPPVEERPILKPKAGAKNDGR
jgi:hypothetical protein